MNWLNWFKNDSSLDEKLSLTSFKLYDRFPGMDQSTLNRNFDFLRLLEEYTWDGIHGIRSFLQWRWYDVKFVRHDNLGRETKFTYKELALIKSWKYLIWLKWFKNDRLKHSVTYSYIIIAEERDNTKIAWIKNKVSKFVIWLFNSPQTH